VFIERACIVFSLVLVVMGVPSCAQPLPELGDDDTGGSTSDDGPAPEPTGSSGGSDPTGPSSDADTEDTGADETGNEPECGNGVVEAGEICDDEGPSATCDVDCTEVACGDGSINTAAGEECEGTDLAGGTCEGLGFDGGTLSCGGRCSSDTSGCADLPDAPLLELGFSQVKRFDFSWAAPIGAEYYQLLESPAPGEPFVQLGEDIVGESVSFEMPLHFRWEASYLLRACNGAGCTDSAAVDVVGSLAEAIGYGVGAWSQQAYVKASNTDAGDHFGFSVALSGDGNTLAVAAVGEGSNATGIGGNQANNSAGSSGAVFVFVRDGAAVWSQQAYVKASNTGSDNFGYSVALSGDGHTLAVGAVLEGSNAMGIGGNQADNTVGGSGAVYVFVRDGVGVWSQQAYVKASNTDGVDNFGGSVALSGDGTTLAIGASGEGSNAMGMGGNPADNTADSSGAVYVFVRDGVWSQQAYVKASNTAASDLFGSSVALSGDGNTLAVGAYWEDSNATGIGGDQADDSASSSGAVYLY
jgi:FG-GAP repeat